jgi:phosphocarrier protein HPr
MAEGAEDPCPDQTDFVGSGGLVRDLPIVNKRGLHARASAKFVQLVERYQADVQVSRCGETVGGTSIMGLMMLSAGIGTHVRVAATGRDAAAVLDALTALLADRFGEED